MTPLWNLLTAILLALPFAPADVQAVGITIRESAPIAEMRAVTPAEFEEPWWGWTSCAGDRCAAWLSVALDDKPEAKARTMRHEALCHSVDWLSDGKMDGAIMGWQPWAESRYAGEPLSDAERLGYWCGGQEVR